MPVPALYETVTFVNNPISNHGPLLGIFQYLLVLSNIVLAEVFVQVASWAQLVSS